MVMDEMQERLINLGVRKVGDFRLSCGVKSDVKWDIEVLYRYPFWMRVEAIKEFIYEVGQRSPKRLIGIETGGLLLAQDIGRCLEIPVYSGRKLSLVGLEHGSLNARLPSSLTSSRPLPDTFIVDDVLTTGVTVAHLIEKLYPYRAKGVVVLVNRGELTEICGRPIVSGFMADKVEPPKVESYTLGQL